MKLTSPERWLDDEAHRALARREVSGPSRSKAIRPAIVVSAHHARRREALRVETAALEADEEDGHATLEAAALMECPVPRAPE